LRYSEPALLARLLVCQPLGAAAIGVVLGSALYALERIFLSVFYMLAQGHDLGLGLFVIGWLGSTAHEQQVNNGDACNGECAARKETLHLWSSFELSDLSP
jgi:hypothetical protein